MTYRIILLIFICFMIVLANLLKSPYQNTIKDSPKELAIKSCIQKQIKMFPDVNTRFYDTCLAIVENREIDRLITEEER